MYERKRTLLLYHDCTIQRTSARANYSASISPKYMQSICHLLFIDHCQNGPPPIASHDTCSKQGGRHCELCRWGRWLPTYSTTSILLPAAGDMWEGKPWSDSPAAVLDQ
ncbi:hypothetical protein MPTK1_2g19030 [Marchantia polymorpha subsp. ruderalis]|uniref:Uncharacterized protein n=1 Tax=Marchantia polymorpha TaxID=3197 RepID=A0A2R6W8K8_MARPO|nr:hypothetical protein MARPO_0128s0018 [Marchantia polymorpha]BBN02892.1 hypothetical protein Mp_2g19030 [Marchantia polymorpha subsp. ruderalis]|eukprot:PTQ30195.1 hypothetical protein MARPO_0128s0018 [Marchantia polymorpha]